MYERTWEPWPSPWFGYEVLRLRHDWGFGSSYEVARNIIGARKWFLTAKAARRHAEKLNNQHRGDSRGGEGSGGAA